MARKTETPSPLNFSSLTPVKEGAGEGETGSLCVKAVNFLYWLQTGQSPAEPS